LAGFVSTILAGAVVYPICYCMTRETPNSEPGSIQGRQEHKNAEQPVTTTGGSLLMHMDMEGHLGPLLEQKRSLLKPGCNVYGMESSAGEGRCRV
jgi:hypothetical protein